MIRVTHTHTHTHVRKYKYICCMRVCGEKRTIALNCSLAPPRCYRTCIRALLLPYVDDLVAQRVRAEAEALGLFHKLFVDGRKGIVDHDHSVLRVDLRIQPAWHEGKGGGEREREREREKSWAALYTSCLIHSHALASSLLLPCIPNQVDNPSFSVVKGHVQSLGQSPHVDSFVNSTVRFEDEESGVLAKLILQCDEEKVVGQHFLQRGTEFISVSQSSPNQTKPNQKQAHA